MQWALALRHSAFLLLAVVTLFATTSPAPAQTPWGAARPFNGANDSVRISDFGLVDSAQGPGGTSADALLMVNNDTTPPTLVSAVRQPNITNILVTYSEAMHTNGLLWANYLVCTDGSWADCLNILQDPGNPDDDYTVIYFTDDTHTQVIIPTEQPMDPNQIYTLFATEISDRAGNYFLGDANAIVSIPVMNMPAAQSIGVNFLGRNGGDVALQPSDVAGVVPQANWRNLPPNEGAGFDGTAGYLVDSVGTLTRVEFVWDCSDAWNSDGGTGTPDEKLMKGIQKANPDPDTDEASSYIYFRWRNLLPGSTYNVIVYQAHNGGPARTSTRIGGITYYSEQETSFDGTWTRSTSTTPGAYVPDTDYVQFDNVSPDAHGVIEVEVKKLIEVPQLTDGIGIPGLQLVKLTGDWPLVTDPPVITAQPQDVLAVVGDTVTFSVGTDGPWTVEWFKNNTSQGTGTSTSFTFTTTAADKDAKVHAIVSNPIGSVTSVVAVLTLDDPLPKQLIQGFLRVEHYGNIAGTAVADLFNDPRFQNRQYDYEFFTLGGNVPQTDPDESNFGRIMEGWVVRSQIGNYNFFIRSDDASEFFVNPTLGSAVDLPPIPSNFTTLLPDATETGCCNDFLEPGAAQTTPAFSLGLDGLDEYYYGVAAVYKEGGWGDYFQLAWRESADSTPAGNLAPLGPENVWCLASPAGKRASITSQPQSVTILQNRSATFEVRATTLPRPNEFAVQWIKDGVNIPGANGTTYTTGPVALADDQAVYQAKVYAVVGLLFSDPATLTVDPDNTPPTPLSAGVFSGGTVVGVLFDEAVDPTSAQNAGHYAVAGVTVSAAALLGTEQRIVRLTVSAAPAASAQVTVNGVTDIAGNPVAGASVVSEASPLTSATLGTAGVDPLRSGQAVHLGSGGYWLQAGGSDIWNQADAGHMAFRQWTGPFDLRVRVENLTGPDIWTKAVLAVRESTAGNARNVVVAATRTAGMNIHQFQWRDAAGGDSDDILDEQRRGPVPYPDAWLRLVREDATSNRIDSYLSTNGVDWMLYHSHTIPGALLPETVVVGLAATAHNNDAAAAYAEALFQDFSVMVQPPFIASGPTVSPGALVFTGGAFNLSVSAGGAVPLSYQWRRAGTNLPGATSTVVSFSSVTTNESGAYDVVISNAGGSLTSAVVNVTVDPAVFRTDVGADCREPAPKPGWQYLQSNLATGGTEMALTYGSVVGDNGNIGYGGGANTFNLGAVLGTNTGANAFKMFVDGQYNAGVAGTDLLVHPGDPVQLGGGGKPFVILRYTLSGADVANGNLALISGSFREMIPGGDSVEAFVFHNGTELFHVVAAGDTLPQASGTFNAQARVAAGDTISFVVGIKGDLYGDETAVRGSITLTAPEAIRLNLARDGSEVILNWTGGLGPYQVEQTTTLSATSSWENVGEPVQTNSVRIPLSPGTLFLRVRGQ